MVFPENVPIGIISDFQLDENIGYYFISVKIYNDMTNLKHIYIIENSQKTEALELLNPDLR